MRSFLLAVTLALATACALTPCWTIDSTGNCATGFHLTIDGVTDLSTVTASSELQQ
jgi:hypothetical protein